MIQNRLTCGEKDFSRQERIRMRKQTGFLRQKKGSAVWYYQTWVNGKAWARSTGETDKAKAEKKLPKLRNVAQLLSERPDASLKLSKAITSEVSRIETDVSEGQAQRVSDALYNFLKWAGDVSLDVIDEGMVENFQRHRLKAAALQTVQKELCSILTLLRNNGFVVQRPSSKPGRSTEQRHLTNEELQNFFAHCPEDLKPLFLLMLVTGARPAELRPSKKSTHKALLKKEVDAETGVITIRSAKRRRNRPVIVRSVPVTPEILKMILDTASKTPGPYVFRPIFNLAFHFDKILKAAGIEKKDELGRKVTAHSFRHTYATQRAEEVNHNPFALKVILGHTQISTTDRYVHSKVDAIAVDPSQWLRPTEPAPIENENAVGGDEETGPSNYEI